MMSIKNRESVTKSNDLQKDNQPLRDARHKIKSHEIDGQVMQRKTCNNLKRPTDIISDSLKNLKDKLKSNVPVLFLGNFLMLLPVDLVMMLISKIQHMDTK